MAVAVGNGATVAVGKGSNTGRLVGEIKTTGTGVAVGDGALVGLATAAATGVLTGTGSGVGMGFDTGRGVVRDKTVSPAALPRVTNTAAMATAETMKSPRSTGTTGKERRDVNSWCCLTSRSSWFSLRKSTEPSFSNKVMIIANSIYTPPMGTGQV